MVSFCDSAPAPLNVVVTPGASVSVPLPVNGTELPLTIAVPLSATVAVWPFMTSPVTPVCRSNDVAVGVVVARVLLPPPHAVSALANSATTTTIGMPVEIFISCRFLKLCWAVVTRRRVLPVDQPAHVFPVARSGNTAGGADGLKPVEFLRRECDGRGCDVLLQIGTPLGAGNRNDVRALL